MFYLCLKCGKGQNRYCQPQQFAHISKIFSYLLNPHFKFKENPIRIDGFPFVDLLSGNSRRVAGSTLKYCIGTNRFHAMLTSANRRNGGARETVQITTMQSARALPFGLEGGEMMSISTVPLTEKTFPRDFLHGLAFGASLWAILVLGTVIA
ncbi:MAG: hypothetical protein AB7U38_04710 [Hyphomicrobiales bacterium]